MKKIIIVLSFILLLITPVALMAQEYTTFSPDKKVKLVVTISNDISYSVWVDNEPVMKDSKLALTINDDVILGNNPKVIKSKKRTVNQVLNPEIAVKSKTINDNFNELNLTFKGKYDVTFRIYENGVAYRFNTNFKKDIIVKDEKASFNFIGDNKVYFPREKEFQSHNERLYEFGNLDTLTTDDLSSLPTLVTAGKTKLLITETALLNYPGMWLTGSKGASLDATFPPYALEQKVDNRRWKDDRDIRVSKPANFIAKTKGKRNFPWRIICIAKSDGDLITNQLTYQLAESSKIEDYSWIKPGKVAWDWWNYNNIYDVDFKAGVNTKTYKYYIDFASKYGIEYVILDEGWYVLGDVLNIVPEVDVKEIINYGKTKNVDVILWVTWSSLDQKLIEALDAFKSWGAKGLKVDFMQRDDQWMVDYYERVAKECAKRELVVNFHGSYKPSGLRRTYPNVLTREGVKGAENNKWANYITPEHNLTLPFIRMVAGPMDYTPGAMINAHKKDFSFNWNRPMSMGTRAHQVAMYTIFESPLQMLCDSPSNYLKEDETTKYISKIPTVWDQTKVLHAKIGEYLALARKNKGQWYIGVMNNQEARELNIDFSFLDEGSYTIEIYKDGINADRYASDYKIITKTIKNTDTAKINLITGGGWSAILKKQK
ncbi:glycoside hydrolase family 97 protein [Cellulophaga fucicola]|uniref:glycoside hydrolase family 97 protein n=1 Tax=Cellulophaga fucicola TaxID=76595 RepID=UPI003EC110B4